ncbi:MAG: hypothetical protein IJ223_04425 [Clostridia bacterium]|nr:hypothetical protein [Clostridia bacterium]
MKLVFVAFDSVSHQPKSTSMISMLQDNTSYSIDSSYVDDINKIEDIYNSVKPDVLFVDTSFDKNDVLEFLTNFKKDNNNKCRIILTYKNKKDKYDFAQTKIPARFFPYKVPADIISYSFKEMSEGIIFSHNKNIDKIIKDFNLNSSSPVTRQFRDCLEILTADNSKYLLFGYLYNAFYTVSKIEDVSLDTIRKSVYKVKDNIDINISPTLRHSIFKDNDIKNMNLPDFFDYIISYIEEQ